MLRIRSILFTGFFIFFTGLSLTIMAACTLFPRPGLHWVVLLWSRTLCRVLRDFIGLDFEVRGREFISPTPAIYAAKHQSAWDTFIYFMIFENPSYVLKKELHRIPFWGRAADKYGAISVDRSGGASALKQLIVDTKNRLERGYNVVIFPEGTR
ncbi:MAG: 1-acyl-sn-glycerol-3-phosphate acyltransferase, partial [Rhodospirillales bacterium]|nr:1-acyl-sn-glycerol-3-phosphate acyltransferase [Rhodospirillales bacterium]